jgi:hypothetical protein
LFLILLVEISSDDCGTETICFDHEDLLEYGKHLDIGVWKGYKGLSKRPGKGWSKTTQYDMDDVLNCCKVVDKSLIFKEDIPSNKIVSNYLHNDAFDTYTFTGEAVEVYVVNVVGEKYTSEYYSVFRILEEPENPLFDNTEGLRYYCNRNGAVKIVSGCRDIYESFCIQNGEADHFLNRVRITYFARLENDPEVIQDEFYVYNTVRGPHVCGCDEYKNAIRNSKFSRRRCPACATYYCPKCTDKIFQRCGVCNLIVNNDYCETSGDLDISIKTDIVMPIKPVKYNTRSKKCKIMI